MTGGDKPKQSKQNVHQCHVCPQQVPHTHKCYCPETELRRLQGEVHDSPSQFMPSQMYQLTAIIPMCTSEPGLGIRYRYQLRAGQSGVRIPLGSMNIYLFSSTQTGSMAHTDSYSTVNDVLSRRQDGRDVKLTAHLHLELRLRMSGAISLLPLYAFTEWRGIVFLF